MGFFDIGLIVVLAGFVFYGLFFGLIRTIGSLLAVIVGVIAASWLYQSTASWAGGIFMGNQLLAKIVCFFIIYTLANRLVAFAVMLIDKFFDILSIIPFLKTINRLAGGLFGLLEGVLLLGLILYAINGQPYLANWLSGWLNKSKIVPYLTLFVETIKPMLPGVLSALRGLV
ncbi:MAG: CvpA family protein [Candidatus Falkowbacteria bacterium]